MTQDEFSKLKNPNEFRLDYRGRKLLTNQNILAHTKASIVNLMDDVIEALKAYHCTVVIHCLYDAPVDGSPHVQNSQHFKGLACDFHVVSGGAYFREIEIVEEVLKLMHVEHAVGLGLYPQWNHTYAREGFHLDTRGYEARWGQIGGQYVGYAEARKWAEKNCA